MTSRWSWGRVVERGHPLWGKSVTFPACWWCFHSLLMTDCGMWNCLAAFKWILLFCSIPMVCYLSFSVEQLQQLYPLLRLEFCELTLDHFVLKLRSHNWLNIVLFLVNLLSECVVNLLSECIYCDINRNHQFMGGTGSQFESRKLIITLKMHLTTTFTAFWTKSESWNQVVAC